jgi:hypothetical protein
MLPQVLQPARFNTPVAEFYLDGLGICHFNQNANPKEWQIAFLRKGHQLVIGIKRLDAQGRVEDTILAPTPIDTPKNLKHLRWVVSDRSDVHLGAGEFPDGFFRDQSNFPSANERHTRDDSHDYRWVLDLVNEVPHQFNGLLGEGRRQPEDRVTIISIPLALFYTRRVTQDNIILARHDQTAQQGFVLGRMNELIGAAVYSTQPGATIQLVDVATGEALQDFPSLPAVPGRRYEISIFNLDDRARGKLDDRARDVNQNYVHGDLDLYYGVMDVPLATRHQLFAPPRTGAGARAIDGDCHLGGAGQNGGSPAGFDLTTLIQP